MHPIEFEGSRPIHKPVNMTDEQCFSIWADDGIDNNGHHYFVTAWKPSYEDLQSLNRGEPVYIKTVSNGLPPMCLFTLDEKGIHQDAN